MELPLCGAAQSRDGGGCIYGAAAARGCSIEGRRGLLVWRTEKGLSVGAAAARGCLVSFATFCFLLQTVCALYCMCFLIVHYCFVNLSACFLYLNHRFFD